VSVPLPKVFYPVRFASLHSNLYAIGDQVHFDELFQWIEMLQQILSPNKLDFKKN
jgi:hypothetical protein